MYVSKSIVHRTSNTSPGAVTGSEVVVGCLRSSFMEQTRHCDPKHSFDSMGYNMVTKDY
jgi:hypothetical protein